ncbi:MAG TPA: serine/threonine-protein kinase [Nannocystaceae bacterium]|nr:serine/threonine-protein kinase [Nannocystaceae bacterium]
MSDVPKNAMRVGRYETLRRIACGAMSELWLARMSGIEGFTKLVVLKWMRDDVDDREQAERMFVREAKIAARLDHPDIVHTLDLGLAQGRHFVAMEYVHGETVAQLLARGGALPEACALRIAIEVLAALAHAHGRTEEDGTPLGIVHRDVSPSNIIVTHEGHVVLVDFGIARANAWEDLTYTGEVKGKLAYAAPEQARGDDVDARADLWATAATLVDLLGGRASADGVATIVHTAMQPDRAQRYMNAAMMRAVLVEEATRRGLDVGAEPLRRLVRERCGVRPHPSGAAESWFLPQVATPVRARPRGTSRRAIGLGAVGSAIAIGAAIAIAIPRDDTPAPTPTTIASEPRTVVPAPVPTAIATPTPAEPPAPARAEATTPRPASKRSRRAPRTRRDPSKRELDALLPSPEVD